MRQTCRPTSGLRRADVNTDMFRAVCEQVVARLYQDGFQPAIIRDTGKRRTIMMLF